MSDKRYDDYMAPLRAREARPPFSEMARLIAGAPSRAGAGFPLFPKVLGIVLFVGTLAVGAWMMWGNISSQETPSLKKEILSVKIGSSGSDKSYWSHEESYSAISEYLSSARSHTEAKAPVLHKTREAGIMQSADSQDADFSSPISECAVREPVISFQENNTAMPPLPVMQSEEEYSGIFFTTIGGAMSQQVSSDAAYRHASFTDAFLGVGYDFSEHSSVRLLAGEEVFTVPSNVTVNNISFQDTVFYHNGQAYQNVLGELHSTNTPSATRTYWLGASYRYTMAETAFAPYAELMAGGAIQGAIGGATVGLSIFRSNSIALDAGAFFRALVPISGATLTKCGASAELQYEW